MQKVLSAAFVALIIAPTTLGIKLESLNGDIYQESIVDVVCTINSEDGSVDYQGCKQEETAKFATQNTPADNESPPEPPISRQITGSGTSGDANTGQETPANDESSAELPDSEEINNVVSSQALESGTIQAGSR